MARCRAARRNRRASVLGVAGTWAQRCGRTTAVLPTALPKRRASATAVAQSALKVDRRVNRSLAQARYAVLAPLRPRSVSASRFRVGKTVSPARTVRATCAARSASVRVLRRPLPQAISAPRLIRPRRVRVVRQKSRLRAIGAFCAATVSLRPIKAGRTVGEPAHRRVYRRPSEPESGSFGASYVCVAVRRPSVRVACEPYVSGKRVVVGAALPVSPVSYATPSRWVCVDKVDVFLPLLFRPKTSRYAVGAARIKPLVVGAYDTVRAVVGVGQGRVGATQAADVAVGVSVADV